MVLPLLWDENHAERDHSAEYVTIAIGYDTSDDLTVTIDWLLVVDECAGILKEEQHDSAFSFRLARRSMPTAPDEPTGALPRTSAVWNRSSP